MKTFDSTPLNEDQKERVGLIRSGFDVLEARVLELCKPSRELSLVRTKLEEACMWAIKGISRE